MPGDHDYHDDKRLIADLTSLNGRASRYVLRHLDADAGRAEPTSPDDELMLGERLVALGEAVQARAARRRDDHPTNGSVVEPDEQAYPAKETNDMSGSHRYLDALKSLHELFDYYPVRAEISSIHIGIDPVGQSLIVVQLHTMNAVVLAAGIIEWRRTLVEGRTWVWRTPSGAEIHVATTGYAPEFEGIPIAVMAGPIPYDCYLDFDLDPDAQAELGHDTLYDWLGNEIANNWPFEPSAHSGATS